MASESHQTLEQQPKVEQKPERNLEHFFPAVYLQEERRENS